MRILAFETATGACTVAVMVDGQVRAELTLQVPRAHSTRLMPLIVQAIAESGLDRTELDAIAAGVGPGSFTGLRIGLATAKGLAFALDKPCVGVPTLLALAYGTGAQAGLILPMLDARRGNLFTALYQQGGAGRGGADPLAWEALIPPCNLHVDELAAELKRLGIAGQMVTLCGDGAAQHGAALGLGEGARLAPAGALLPRAWAVAEVARAMLGRGGDFTPEALSPLYLRKSEAERVWEARRSPSAP